MYRPRPEPPVDIDREIRNELNRIKEGVRTKPLSEKDCEAYRELKIALYRILTDQVDLFQKGRLPPGMKAVRCFVSDLTMTMSDVRIRIARYNMRYEKGVDDLAAVVDVLADEYDLEVQARSDEVCVLRIKVKEAEKESSEP
jgi:hypothetical protein